MPGPNVLGVAPEVFWIVRNGLLPATLLELILKAVVEAVTVLMNVGVVIVGLVSKTSTPVPSSSVICPAMPEESVVAVNAEVPLPMRMPVSEVAPVPPEETPSVPEKLLRERQEPLRA